MSKPGDQTPPNHPERKPFDPETDRTLPEGAFDKTLPEDEGLATSDEASTAFGDLPDSSEPEESTAIEPKLSDANRDRSQDEFGKSTADDLLAPQADNDLSTMVGNDPEQEVTDGATMIAHDETGDASPENEFGKTTASELISPPPLDESATQVGDEDNPATSDDATMNGLDEDAANEDSEDLYLKTLPTRVLAQLDDDDFAMKTMSMDDPFSDAEDTFSDEDFGKTLPASSLALGARDEFADQTMMMDGDESALADEDLDKTLPEGALAPTTPEAATMLEDGSGTADQDDGFGKTVQADAFSKTIAADDAADGVGSIASDTAPENFEAKTIVGADSAVEGQVSMSAKTIADPNLHRTGDSVLSSRATRAGGRTSIDGTEVLGADAVDGIDQESLNVAMRSIGGLQYGVIPRVDFKLVKQLGEGGMGVVYVAKQQSLGREVVFKTLKPIPESQASKMKGSGTINSIIKHRTDMFLSEAVVTADLFHPNIVPIYELAKAPDGSLFYTMKWVRGDGWHKRIKEMTLEENLEVLMKVCDAVGFAHSRHIVNRDLKPENVMLGGYGETIVLDWGLALPFGEGKDRLPLAKTAGLGSGTPAYMPPELIKGPIEKVGPACDIYLLGAMLFEVVTGVPPHDFSSSPSKGTLSKGAKMQEIRRVVTDNVIRDTGHTGELIDIAKKAMATELDDRYQSVADLQDAIRDYRRHAASRTLVERAKELTCVAPPPVTAEAKPDPNTPTIGYANYQNAVALYNESLREWPGNNDARVGLSDTQKSYAELALTKGDFDLGLSVLDTNAGSHTETRTKLLKAREEREGRVRVMKVLKLTAVGLLIGIAGVSTFAARAHLNFLATEEKRLAAVKDMERAEEKAADADKKAAEADMKAIAADMRAVEADEKAIEADKNAIAANNKAEKAKADAVDADMRALAADKKAKDATIREVAAKVAEADAIKLKDQALKDKAKADKDAQDALIAKREAEKDAEAALAAKNKADYQKGLADATRKFYEGDYPETLRKLSTLKNKYKELCKEEWDQLQRAASAPDMLSLSDPAKPVESISLSRDGRKLAAGDSSGRIVIWKVDANGTVEKEPIRRLSLPLAPDSRLRVVAMSPDGTQVAAAGSDDGLIRIWSLTAADADPPQIELKGPLNAQAVNTLKFSRDGKRLASGSDDRRVRLWSVEEKRLLVEDQVQYPVQCVDWSDDGQWLVAGTSAPEGTSGVAYSWKVQPRDDYLTLTRTRLFQTVPDGNERVKQNRGVFAIALTSDGKYAVSNGPASELYLWQVDPPKDEKSSNVSPTVSVAPTDSRSKPESRSFGKWPLYVKKDETTTRRLGEHSKRVERVRSVAFSAKTQQLFVAGDDGDISIWDRVAGESFPHYKRQKLISGHGGPVRGCLPLPQSSNLFVSGSYDKNVHRWDLKTYFELRKPYDTESTPEAAFQPAETDVSTGGSSCQSDEPECRPEPAEIGQVFETELPKSTPARSELALVNFPRSKQDVSQKDSKSKEPATANGTPRKSVHIAAGINKQNERIGHSDSIYSAVFSRDGKRVISASRDQTARAWNSETGLPVVTITGEHPVFRDDDEFDNQFREGHEYDLFTMRFFPDGQRLLTSGFDGEMRIWDSRIDDQNSFGRELATLDNTSMFGVVEISRDGQWVLTAGRGNGTAAGRSKNSDSEEPDPLALLWKTENIFNHRWPRPELQLHKGHRFRVTAVAIAPDNKRLLTGDREGKIILWDAETGTAVGKPRFPHRGEIVKLEFLGDGSRLLTAGVDRLVRLWSVTKSDSDFQLENVADFRHDAMIANLAVSPLGDRFISVTTRLEKQGKDDKNEFLITKTSLWNIDSGEERVINLPTRANDNRKRTDRERGRDRPPFPSWAPAPNGTRAIITTSEGFTTSRGITTSEGIVHFYDSQTFEITDSLHVDNDEPDGAGYRAEPYAAMLLPNPDGKKPPHLITQTSNAAFLWRLKGQESGEHVSSFRPQGPVFSAGYSSDGCFVVTGGRSLRIFDADEKNKITYGRPLYKVEHPHEGIVTSVEFTPAKNSNRFLTTGNDGIAKIWEWQPKNSKVVGPLHTLRGHEGSVRFGTWSTSGSRVLTVGDDAIPRIWTLSSEDAPKPGEEIKPLELKFPKDLVDAKPDEWNRKFHQLCGAFSWDDNFVAVGGRDADTGESLGWIWNLVPTPQLYATIRGHGLGGIKSVAFLPKDERLITGGDDGTARLWDWQKAAVADNAGQVVEADFLISLVRQTKDRQRTTHRGAVNSVRVTPDGDIVTASSDGTVLIWPK